MLFLGQLDKALQARIATDMYERRVPAGEILIQEGDAGSAAAELYIVKEGEFEVRCSLKQSALSYVSPAVIQSAGTLARDPRRQSARSAHTIAASGARLERCMPPTSSPAENQLVSCTSVEPLTSRVQHIAGPPIELCASCQRRVGSVGAR